jgi:hypothetical protein
LSGLPCGCKLGAGQLLLLLLLLLLLRILGLCALCVVLATSSSVVALL